MAAVDRQALTMLRGLLTPRSLTLNAASAAFGAFLVLACIYWFGSGPSVTIDSRPFELDGVAQRGGHIDLVYDFTRYRVCPSEVVRILWRDVPMPDGETGRQIFGLADSAPLAPVLGHQRVIISIPLPPGIDTGSWNYSSTVTEHCGWFQLFTRVRVTPDIPVKITAIDGSRQFGMR